MVLHRVRSLFPCYTSCCFLTRVVYLWKDVYIRVGVFLSSRLNMTYVLLHGLPHFGCHLKASLYVH